MQFKSSTRKKLKQLDISKFDSANISLNCRARFNSQFSTGNYDKLLTYSFAETCIS